MARTGQQGERLFTASQYRQYKRAQEIRDRHADGEPLAGRDLAFMVRLLKQHPRAQAKIGCGADAILVHHYIGGSRCFFVLRQDGSLEDFSVRKCLGLELRRTSRVREMMRLVDFTVVARAYWRFAARRTAAPAHGVTRCSPGKQTSPSPSRGAEYDPPVFSGWPLESCCPAARGRQSTGKCLIGFQLPPPACGLLGISRDAGGAATRSSRPPRRLGVPAR